MNTRGMSALLSGFPPCDLPGQAGEFAAVNDLAVHHAHEQLLNRSPVKGIDHASDGAGGDALARLNTGIDIRPALDAMLDVALVLKPLENRAGRGLFHEVSFLERPANVLRGRRTAFPQRVHDKVLEIAKVLFSAKHCSATNCSADVRGCK